jgi:hypothetical protein
MKNDLFENQGDEKMKSLADTKYSLQILQCLK